MKLGIYQIGNLDTRRINVGANIKRVRVQQRPNSNICTYSLLFLPRQLIFFKSLYAILLVFAIPFDLCITRNDWPIKLDFNFFVFI